MLFLGKLFEKRTISWACLPKLTSKMPKQGFFFKWCPQKSNRGEDDFADKSCISLYIHCYLLSKWRSILSCRTRAGSSHGSRNIQPQRRIDDVMGLIDWLIDGSIQRCCVLVPLCLLAWLCLFAFWRKNNRIPSAVCTKAVRYIGFSVKAYFF